MHEPGAARVTLHMATSLDGFVARANGAVDWIETEDEFAEGRPLDAAAVEACLRTIDCYVMGSRTYATALDFEARGNGWAYGDKPTFVLTQRKLPRTRASVEFHEGDLAEFVNERLRRSFQSIWVVGGRTVAAECLRLGLVDEVRLTVVPILIGQGLPWFGTLDSDQPLHLAKVDAFRNGMVELVYDVQRARHGPAR